MFVCWFVILLFICTAVHAGGSCRFAGVKNPRERLKKSTEIHISRWGISSCLSEISLF